VDLDRDVAGIGAELEGVACDSGPATASVAPVEPPSTASAPGWERSPQIRDDTCGGPASIEMRVSPAWERHQSAATVDAPPSTRRVKGPAAPERPREERRDDSAL
jgi:hypothetical protein